MAQARRCSLCGVDWPPVPGYQNCPACEGNTDVVTNGSPLPYDEAKRRAAQCEFDRWLDAGKRTEFWEDDDERWGGRSPGRVLAMVEEIGALNQIPTLNEGS